jgi:hypothetical protein
LNLVVEFAPLISASTCAHTAATPSRIGHTHLRSLQETLHPKGWDGSDLPYYSFADLSESGDVEGLINWRWLLTINPGRSARGHISGVLVPSLGDGSGTGGTGGTILYDDVDFEMWMGTWHPRLFHFSAVWKEMRTLLATLERAWARKKEGLAGVTFSASPIIWLHTMRSRRAVRSLPRYMPWWYASSNLRFF